MELLIIAALILLNGLFSMSEIAFVSSRKSRLEVEAKKGSKKARRALDLVNSPERLLSTVQIFITVIGVLTAIYSGESFAYHLDSFFEQFPVIAPYAHTISVAVIVICVTYFTLIFGELVPKRLGMNSPERIAKLVAGLMNALSVIALPFIWLLSASTRLVLSVFKIKPSSDSKVTEEEIKAIIQEGTEDGEVQEVEQDIVERVFHLGDRKIQSVLTHKNDLIWIDVNDAREEIIAKIAEDIHNIYPVADGNLDEILGVVKLKDLFMRINHDDFNIRNYIFEPPYIHENITVYRALEKFKATGIHYAIVADEFGSVQGIVTMNDILEELVGEMHEEGDDEYQMVERTDGSWLVDGQYPFYDFLDHFDMQNLHVDYPYNTVGGMILDRLDHLPQEGEKLKWLDFDIEVLDMDKVRIDKVLVTKQN